MSFSGATIQKIESASPASRAGLRPGDKVLSCNGSPVNDWVDLLSMSFSARASLKISRGPVNRVIKLRRRPGVPWGIELEGSQARRCRNKCIFCFIDQQPPGLRGSLTEKDDDVRYSFLSGTFITLTSQQTDEAIARGFSSLHISVQTTDPILRGKMLGLPGPIAVLPQIDRLADSGIVVEAQIVEVPGWNNGEELERSIADLYNRPNVEILGIVPVGLTKWREGLEPITRPDREEAGQTLEIIETWQRKALKERKTPWVYPADEYYSITGKEIPPLNFYEECSLAANGIGLLAQMINECSNREYSEGGLIITGSMAAPYIREITANTRYRVLPVTNTLMGSQVTVAGLLSGSDVVNAVKQSHSDGVKVFLPSAMFNHNGVTLDEYTVEKIIEETGAEVISVTSICELL